MSLKARILHDSELNNNKWLEEMAAAELKSVLGLIKDGKYKEAAEKYIESGGSPRPNAISRTVNSYFAKNPDADHSTLEAFRTAVVNFSLSKPKEIKSEEAKDAKARKKYKKETITGTVKTKDGKEIKIDAGRTAEAQRGIEKKQEKHIVKGTGKSKAEEEILSSGTVEQKRALAKDIYNDQKNSGDIRALKTWINKGTEISDTSAAGTAKSKTTKMSVDKDYIKRLIANHIPEDEKPLVNKLDDEQLDRITKAMLSAWEKDLNILKKFDTKGENQQKAEEIMRGSLGKGSEDFGIFGTGFLNKLILAKKRREDKMEESVSLYESILRRTYDYEGHMFWENFILSNLVRTFSKDLEEYGEEAATKMYASIYGKETKPLFEYMLENEEELFEASKIAKTGLLFERVGKKNVDKYLTEIEVGGLGAAAFSGFKGGPGVLGFLRGAWQKFKGIVSPVLKNIGAFLSAKFPWAKDLVTKGAAWFATNPIARVLVPAVLVAGSLVAAKKLINRIRKKRNMKKMSAAEEAEATNLYNKSKGKIASIRQRVGKKAA